MSKSKGLGWAGTVHEFLATPQPVWVDELREHHESLWRMPPAATQSDAWTAEHRAMVTALRRCCDALPGEAPEWGVVFEYELPLEGGRRPDVVVLAGRTLCVLEFKSAGIPLQSDLDQVRGYVRDLLDYHAASHDLDHRAILVLEGAVPGFAGVIEHVVVTASDGIAAYLLEAQRPGTVDLDAWVDAPYRPLPTLIEAARRIFMDEPLPHVKSALAAGIPETVDYLGSVVDAAAADGQRALAFVTGVPGAGKTLVGLRVVHERAQIHGRATFLSGNGPLVQVLQDALKSRVFVRDLHAFIKTYALNQRRRVPEEHVIVFDEAQRAWDSKYMHAKKNVQNSEPELLIRIGETIDSWAALVGLVGEGQEIHSGEEAGIGQWATAAQPPSADAEWVVHCAPKLASAFDGVEVHTSEKLDLTVSLRSRRAEHLHDWVRLVLSGSLPLAARRATRIHADAYPIYVTRDLAEARTYVHARYADEPLKRTGLLASSHAKSLEKYGIANGYLATSRMNIARWYNASPDHPEASNALVQPVTEFGCQGLELDLPIVCWGEDYRWNGSSWDRSPVRRRYRQDDPEQLLENAYRVLLTRGRDGLVVFVPPSASMDATEVALLAAGVRPIPESQAIVAELLA